MTDPEAQHIVHSIVNFELSQNEIEAVESEELDNSNLISINNYNKFKRNL